jgi:uncharacterized membrane protein YeaQ/YmgE (transglycosylase-associated protein family)
MVFGVIIWLVIGGIVGWLASIVMRIDTPQGILTNIIVGLSGSYVGGAFVAPFVRIGALGSYLTAFAGALLLLGIINLIRCGKFR